MERGLKLFFLFLISTYFGLAAGHSNTGGSINFSDSANCINISQAHTSSSMKKNEPTDTHPFLFFRKGLAEKVVLIPHPTKTAYRYTYSTDVVLANPARIKYILSFSGFLVIQPQFLYSSSPHSPPVLC